MILAPDGSILFSDDELRCPASGGLVLAPGFADALRALRLAFGRPMIVNSCCRSQAHNEAIGGHPRSLHVYDEPYHPTGGGCAIDIHIPDGIYRGELMARAWERGWSIGIASTFLHLDRRADRLRLPQTTFTYA